MDWFEDYGVFIIIAFIVLWLVCWWIVAKINRGKKVDETSRQAGEFSESDERASRQADEFKRMLQAEKGIDYFRCTSCKWNYPNSCHNSKRPLLRWTEYCKDFEKK